MLDTAELLSLRPAGGHLDGLTRARGRLGAHGWMFEPGHVLERIDAYLDGQPAGPVFSVDRPDVEKAMLCADGGKPAGFRVEIPLGGTVPLRLDLVGRIAEAPAVRLSCFIPSARDLQAPQPPPELAKRVSKMQGAEFRTQGLKMFTDLADQMTRLGIHTGGRILDWGCGCGRVASHFQSRLAGARLIGCDIDAQAIEWCRGHIAGEFVRIDPEPPTPFGDGAADIIVACSVLTHLDAAAQERWLLEMRRLLAPGGSFLASTNGDFMFQLSWGRGRRARIRSAWRRLTGVGRLRGIRDTQRDRTLDGIAPKGYYRAVFQSRAYTIDTCSKYFEVVDYVERGLNGHQDLVILRRAA